MQAAAGLDRLGRLAAQLGGATEAADQREFGHAQVEIVAGDALFSGLTDHDGAPPVMRTPCEHAAR